MRACRVVSHHPADCCSICSCGVGTEQESHGPQVQVELLLYNAGFDDCPSLLSIHLEHPVEVLRHVHDDRVAHGLSGETGTGASRQNGNFEVVRNLHCREHVFLRLGHNYADRLDFIDAGVCAVHEAGGAVKAHLARNPLLEGLLKIFIHSAESVACRKRKNLRQLGRASSGFKIHPQPNLGYHRGNSEP